MDPFYSSLLAGMEEELDRHGASVLVQVLPDHADHLAAYRRWAGAGGGPLVAGVLVCDLVDPDPRPDACAVLGLPVVVLGGADDLPAAGRHDGRAPLEGPGEGPDAAPGPGSGPWLVEVDDADAVRRAVEFLAGLGHRRVARVSGPARYRHTRLRAEAFALTAAALGVHVVERPGEFTSAGGAGATAALLGLDPAPTAIVYDDDVMAAAGSACAQRLGLHVPHDLSVLAWDDSTLCRVANPPLSVMARDVHALGVLTARTLLDAAAGTGPRHRRGPGARVVERASTAAPGR